MRGFLNSLSSILFDDTQELQIATRAFKTYKLKIPIYAGSILTPEISHLILRAKESNDLIARKFLAKLVVDAISLTKQSEINLIPIPSRAEAVRNRGIKHINELVKEVNKLQPVRTFYILEHQRKIADQSRLGSAARFENMREAFGVNKNTSPRNAFLFDDLVTTGATIAAAAKALEVRNIQLLGVISACASALFTE
jgi:predicted amidophosphoribosyltransferase